MLKKLFPKKKKKENIGLWSSNWEFDEEWKNRISTMAAYINTSGTVADFGCGLMWLEPLLKPENTYLPIDYIARDERTLVIDLNKDLLPELNADIAFLSGVLEYVIDIENFVYNLTNKNFKKIILSYCTLEKFSDVNGRESLNWVSHKSIFDILSMFTSKYSLSAINDVKGNTIFVFDCKAL
ncbi:hypothetical protein H6F42_06910 [Pseudanabaena sp. FACHB-1998]|uniref:hypothetical protein n=1 Tax=Pseudanabaena sp. FACHB-1998 TaxID=2692858 RepID=UPI001681BF0D|nr:hypothetical protein [Pseudanabaena sp. FACHB-1998]MBD2176644.1 hypothetical protein [Pseudanabaena sp. FACHB-1998]